MLREVFEGTQGLIGSATLLSVEVSGDILAAVFGVARYVLHPAHRIYFVYLATSLLMAGFVYWRIRQRPNQKPETFLSFLFPGSVWSNSSAWLDVRYFFFHRVITRLIFTGYLLVLITLFAGIGQGAADWVAGRALPVRDSIDAEFALLFPIVLTLAYDFAAYAMHNLQHRWWFLWEFHKVHHSATVLHPLSNYREHPIDNMANGLAHSIGAGVVTFSWGVVTGVVPSLTLLMGGTLIAWLFNAVGYNLRHSHIWVRWPGPLSKLFGSPAHHQVHHSAHPDHINKNMAFIFPIWDVVFGTYCLPSDNRDLRFGLGTQEERDFNSCLALYLLPFRNVARRLYRAWSGSASGEPGGMGTTSSRASRP